MNIGEATRQHQATLEAVRATRSMFGGIYSAEDELAAAEQELARSSEQLDKAWLEAIL